LQSAKTNQSISGRIFLYRQSDMIQALARRWRSDKSVAIFARLNPMEFSVRVVKA